MLHDLSAIGGQELSDEDTNWLSFENRIRQGLEAADHRFQIAESAGPLSHPVGLVEASVTYPAPVYRRRKVLHIHSLYVLPGHRRQGIGEALLRSALEWGRREGCVEAELSTLSQNPARYLFEGLGFEVYKLEMRTSLLEILVK